jgi:hypothetical protein
VPPPPTSALTLAIGTSERHGLNGMQGSCDQKGNARIQRRAEADS